MNENTNSEGKGFYYGPLVVYAILLLCQYVSWFGEPNAHTGWLLLSMMFSGIQVFYGSILPFDRVTFTFWVSCVAWVASMAVHLLLAQVFPSFTILIGLGVCLMLMYEGYARALNRSGCSTFRENVFPRLFLKARMGVSARVKRSQDDNKPGSKGSITNPTYQNFNFSHLYGMIEEKKRIKTVALEILTGFKTKKPSRNGILLTGEPGNGKTELAKALAGELNLPFVEITRGRVASMWINETTKNIMQGISEAKQKAPCVLLIDEIDSFLKDRSSNKNSYSEDADIVNTLLTELVNLRSNGVIIVAATNHVEKLDSAGIREGRFDIKIEVMPPDVHARELILEKSLKKALPKVRIEQGAIANAVKRWSGFSVVRLLAIAKEIQVQQQESNSEVITSNDIFTALRTLQGSHGLNVDNAKGIANMLLPCELKESLESIVYRMKNIHEIEEAGGSLPTGLVFYGSDPGTGKTECARSLAKESGWAFLATTSNDLIKDSDLLDKLYKDALNIRPCIIFIDEANDVLRDRNYSASSTLANKLLTVMDGVASEKRDIMFVAATNFIEQIDVAFLRGGRISEKFHFTVPNISDQVNFINNLIRKSKARFSDEVTGEVIAFMMAEHGVKGSVANMEAIVQDSINSMISKRISDGEVLQMDVKKAVVRQST